MIGHLLQRLTAVPSVCTCNVPLPVQDKGSTALHVAARSGQAYQVELLLVYGADPTARDSRGLTPADCAREAGHTDLEARLIESQYEVTDRLAYHLSGRNPGQSS
ncbi:hypothetical protein V5799_025077 [Amblyomma americanum]|uniref:Uncharacterized protein n=1 Tax=Amblyomma americanum TaxID=6943 RepID=A0AAQ4EAL7_AMBAM